MPPPKNPTTPLDPVAQLVADLNLGATFLQIPQVHAIFGGKLPADVAKIVSFSIYIKYLTLIFTEMRRRLQLGARLTKAKKEKAEEEKIAGEKAATAPQKAGTRSLPAGTSSDKYDSDADENRLFRLYPMPDQRRPPVNEGPPETEWTGFADWKVDTLEGTEELSKGFSFHVRLIAPAEIFDLGSYIGKTLTIGIKQLHKTLPLKKGVENNTNSGRTADPEDPWYQEYGEDSRPERRPLQEPERYFDGLVTELSFDRTDGGQAFYSLTLEPWTYLLTQDRDSRLFLGRTAPQIVEQVLKRYVDDEVFGPIVDYELRLSREYKPIKVATQYNETNFEFLNRLFEGLGWTFYFVFSKNGHRLVITDDSPAHCASIAEPYSPITFNGRSFVAMEHTVSEMSVIRTLQPAKVSLRSAYSPRTPRNPLAADVPTLAKGATSHTDWYVADPSLQAGSRADVEEAALRYMKHFESRMESYQGRSDCPAFQAGCTFLLSGYFPSAASAPQDQRPSRKLLLRKVRHAGRNNIGVDRNTGAGHTAEYANSFECIAAEVPYVPEMIHPKPTIAGAQVARVTGPKGKDIHTNRHGAVKVLFAWDRYGSDDDSSSGWVQVAHANDMMSIPHVDDYVLVIFPDLDAPLIVGTVSNAHRPLAHAHDDHDRKGFVTRSVGPGAKDRYSALVLDNKAGKERFLMKAQHDREVVVHNNDYLNVMQGNLNIDVFHGSSMVRAKQNVLVESVDGEMHVKAGKTITISASKGVTLVCGDSKIVIDPHGIQIESKKVIVKGPDGIHLN
jgi:type VI secretion system secreted protein VgrG